MIDVVLFDIGGTLHTVTNNETLRTAFAKRLRERLSDYGIAITGEDEHGRVVGRHRSTGIARPRFWDRARYYGLERELADALDAAE